MDPNRNASGKRPLSTISADSSQAPTRKQTKWTAQEDELIISLRGSGMKWETISKQFPGRSAIACRLHYQNFLERKPAWDEEKKNKLARLYERFKQQMWEPVAKELGMPWRAAEAMHWQLGSEGMASRAGTTPFSSTPSSTRPPPGMAEAMGYMPDPAYHQPQLYAPSAMQGPPMPYPSSYQPSIRPTHDMMNPSISMQHQPSLHPHPHHLHHPPPPPPPSHYAPSVWSGAGPSMSAHGTSEPLSVPGQIAQNPRDYHPSSTYYQRPRQHSLPSAHSYPPSASIRHDPYDGLRVELPAPPPPPPQYTGPFLKPPLPGISTATQEPTRQQPEISPRLPPIRTIEGQGVEKQDQKSSYKGSSPDTSRSRS